MTFPAVTPHETPRYLDPIDRDGLLAFAEKGRNNPTARGKNNVRAVMLGKYRSLSYVGDHEPVVVDEPLHISATTPRRRREKSSCPVSGGLAVGVTAVATWKGVRLSKLEILIEADIGNPAA